MSDWIDYDTEAGHLYEMYDGDEIEPWEDYDDFCGLKDIVREGVEMDETNYKMNKLVKVGTTMTCAGPMCSKKIVKKQYAQCFCCNHCKDQFWNRREAYFGYRKKISLK